MCSSIPGFSVLVVLGKKQNATVQFCWPVYLDVLKSIRISKEPVFDLLLCMHYEIINNLTDTMLNDKFESIFT